MLDFTHKFNERLNQLIDQSLVQQNKQQQVRSYLGASRLGVNCSRQLQYEVSNTPKDEGKDFTGQTLRRFAAGHLFEQLAIGWLRGAGFGLLTENTEGKQFGFMAAGGLMAGHVDGIITGVPEGVSIQTPALWEMKSMNSKTWRETVKKGLVIAQPLYAAQIALYQAYMEGLFPDIATNPALFTAINKDTAELYHELIPFDSQLAQRISDKAVNIIRANEVGELLPRIAGNSDYYECKLCPYYNRCWEVGNGLSPSE